MTTMLRLLICLLSAAASVHAGENLPAMQIGIGEYARGTFPRNAAWLGLFCSDQGCVLRPIAVAFEEAVAFGVLEEAEPTERLRVDGEPLAMFVEAGLTPGRVETAFWRGGPDAAGPDRMQGRWAIPGAPRPVILSWTASEDAQTFRHDIADGSRSQTLFTLAAEGHYGSDTSLPEIVWAGDLDRDGRIDLVLSLPDDNCGFDQRLYLSSRAEGGELLRLSAQLAGGLPACGC